MNKKLTIQTFLVMMLTFTFIGTGYSLDTCELLITSDYTLEHDLDCEGTAIIIGADGITVDLNGHTLTGDGSGAGINNIDGCHTNGYQHGCDDVTIKDGIIDGFRWGIRLVDADRNTIEELEISNSTSMAIYLEESEYNHVTESVFIGKSNMTTWGVYLEEAYYTLIEQNIFMKNAIGLELDGSRYNNITQNIFKNNKNKDIVDNKAHLNDYDENKCKESDPNSICQ